MGEITERSLYPILIQVIKEHGGTGVSEIKFNSEPDIVFDYQERKWLLSVKIGETIPVLKQAFIQYQRHKDESKINHGIILFFPDAIRTCIPEESIMLENVQRSKCACLIDTPDIKEELRRITFPQILVQIEQEITPKLIRREQKAFPLNTVISLLQEHVSDLMKNAALSDEDMLRIITDKKLLSEIGHLKDKEALETSRFLAAYIVLSQIMFLRLFSRTRKDILPKRERKISYHWLRLAFRRIRDINYRPIYELDVLDAIPEAYVQDTFDLIWGLEIERVKHELPGRIFHELMPKTIRKMLAAFYTRPQAADLLAKLTINKSGQTLFDPACGSGTILIAGYKRKNDLFREEGHSGNPHKRFCEEEIFGSDIMPFAVHLTGANLASMDPATTIDRTHIIQGDTLELSKGRLYKNGVQLTLFPKARKGYTTKGETHEVKLDKVDVILMNPPFTKVERGIREYVDMEKFGSVCGNEVGLWGHFIAFVHEFLNDDGIFGGVIPISILRGRESQKIRDFIFSNWTPLYIIKSTFNYGFSEWSEYRDILLITRKGKAPKGHLVKFVLLKKDLRGLTKSDVFHIANQIEIKDNLRSSEVDIESFAIEEIRKRFMNLMWFCGTSSFDNRDMLVSFTSRFEDSFADLPENYLREGYRLTHGTSSFMFLTRRLEDSRTEEAFLHFDSESPDFVKAKSMMAVDYRIEKSALSPSLRTGVGINTLHLKGKLDFIANNPYRELDKVLKASKFVKPENFDWKKHWKNVEREINKTKTKLVTIRRINPYSPNTYLISFFSEKAFLPTDLFKVVAEEDVDTAKALCVVLNSILFLSQFFLLKEDTTGRYLDIRTYDYYEMHIFPKKEKIKNLVRIFDKFSRQEFPSLREQLDQNFDQRYSAFWDEIKKGQKSLFSLKQQVNPSKVRMDFDLNVCRALGIPVTRDELYDIYKVIIEEMIITRGLTRD